MNASLQLQPGDVFAGKYRVDRLVKAGGMGAVYAAVHTATMRKVALKIMRPEIVADPNARERFAREAQVSARIESVHCVDVLDAGIDPATGVPFLVMELLVGKELGELLEERGRFAPGDVVQWLAQAARALDRAHASGIVHRDLKPENLFLAMRDGEAPTIKVLDFGIARILDGATNRATMATGTPLYMAPEQTSRSAAIGPHTDVWALGLTAYTFLVGRPYWHGADLRQLYGEILGAPMEPPTERASRLGVQLPPAFDAWFFRCVEREPQRRASRAGEAIRALGDALGAAMTTTPAPSPAAATMMPSGAQTAWAPPPPGAANASATTHAPNAPVGAGTARMAAPPAYSAAQPAHAAPIAHIPSHPSAGQGAAPRARSGAPIALLVVLGAIAAGAIGGGLWLAVGGSGSGSSASASSAAANDESPETKKKKKASAAGDDDDSITAKPSDPKPIEPPIAEADDHAAPNAESALHVAPPKPQPTFVAPKPTAPPPPPPPVPTPTPTPTPKMNCAPGVANEQGRCTCPSGFRSVGPSGSARCVADAPVPDNAPGF